MAEPAMLTDHAFSEALQCPLRLEYHRLTASAASSPLRGMGRFKTSVRTWLRGVFIQAHGLPALQPPRATSGDLDLPNLEPWLRAQPCGAVTDLYIRTGGFAGRMPLLFRTEGDGWVLAQLQGRRWPGHLTRLDPSQEVNRKVERYLWQLGYRHHLLSLAAPGMSVRCELLFPNAGFRSPSDGLFDRLSAPAPADDDIAAIKGAFVRVDVTEQIAQRLQSVQHDWKGWSFQEPVSWSAWLERLQLHETGASFKPGRHCGACDYRIHIGGEAGCWQRHGAVAPDALISPGLHVLDLPGHGNDHLLAQGVLFQEQADASSAEGLPGSREGSVDDLPPTFSLQWRRDRQIRSVKRRLPEAAVPPEAAAPPVTTAPFEAAHPTLLQRIRELAFPLHCIDFEAASFPVPIREGSALYEPVLFQYSCHTIRPEGITHHHWLDAAAAPDPETPLLESLLSIEEIHRGTIVHFAPFEQQHLQRMARNTADPSLKFQLRRLLQSDSSPAKPRFFDLSRWLRDFYHHDAMNGGLGLKNLLPAMVRTSSSELLRSTPSVIMGFDPDRVLSDGNVRPSAIRNGEDAMHAYLAMRAGLMEAADVEDTLRDLLEYCALDTFTIVLTLHRWMALASSDDAPVPPSGS